MLLSGHAFLYCWYLYVYDALGDGADKTKSDYMLRLLYESSLTVTIHMYAAEDKSSLALEANRVSEFLRASQRVSVNSFLTFAQNVALIGGSKPDLRKLMSKDLQYNGGLINAAMLKVIAQLKTIESDESTYLFRLLDREFGQDILTGSYNKLKLFCSTAKTPAGACWILMSQLVALRRQEVTVLDFPPDRLQQNGREPQLHADFLGKSSYDQALGECWRRRDERRCGAGQQAERNPPGLGHTV